MRRYIPPIYWLGIVLISVVGTQITDNLTDNHGVALETTTIVFAIALAVTSPPGTRASERCRSTRSSTSRREAFYWLTVLFTFALGTAAGDLTAERLELGYCLSALLFAGLIAAVTLAHFRFRLNAITALLARLHPHAAARGVARRLPLAAARERRASDSVPR